MENIILCQNEIKTEPLKTLGNRIGNVNNYIITDTKTKNNKDNEKSEKVLKIGRIYLITNLINDKKYVGLTTKSLEQRFKRHIHCSNSKNNDYSIVLQRAIKKYGFEQFTIELIEELTNITEDNLHLKESFYINKYNTFVDGGWGYNMLKISSEKLVISKEIREKISNKMKGKNNPFYGKRHSFEMRKKLSQIHTGKFHNKETRKLLSKLQTGKYLGENALSFDDTIYHFKHTETDEEYNGYQFSFRTKFGLNKSSVNALLKGRLKTLKGWKLVRA